MVRTAGGEVPDGSFWTIQPLGPRSAKTWVEWTVVVINPQNEDRRQDKVLLRFIFGNNERTTCTRGLLGYPIERFERITSSYRLVWTLDHHDNS